MDSSKWAINGQVKVDRAREHVRALVEEIAAFHGRQPYSLVAEDERTTGDRVIRMKIREYPPLRWGAIVGDAVHNLRSVLDLLVCQLVERAGVAVGTQHAFPIHETERDFRERAPHQLKGLSPALTQRIASLRPYRDGNYHLYTLHRLDIIDKHRTLVPAFSSVGVTIFDFAPRLESHWRESFPDDTNFKGIPPMPLGINWADPACPVQDGEELWRLKADQRHPSDVDPTFRATIALGGDSPVKKGRPVDDVLRELADSVDAVVAQFPELHSS